MSELELQPLRLDGVKGEPELAGDVLRVTFSGSVGMRDPGEALDPFFGALDDEALRLGLSTVEVDLRGVTFMNSSGIATLARWIARIEARAEPAYRLVFRYDRKVAWQRTNAPMLALLAPGIVSATA